MKLYLVAQLKKLQALPATYQMAIVIVASLCATSIAYAFAAPAVGDFAYEVYDFVVLRILNGPIGFVLGCGAMCVGALQAFRNQVMGGIVIASAGILAMNAENLITALGAVV